MTEVIRVSTYLVGEYPCEVTVKRWGSTTETEGWVVTATKSYPKENEIVGRIVVKEEEPDRVFDLAQQLSERCKKIDAAYKAWKAEIRMTEDWIREVDELQRGPLNGSISNG